MSSLSVVTDTPVLLVTQHFLSCFHPSVVMLSLFPLDCAFNIRGRIEADEVGVPLFMLARACFMICGLLLTVPAQVTTISTLLVYQFPLPAAVSLWGLCSGGGGDYFLQPCWLSSSCFCHLMFKDLVNDLVQCPFFTIMEVLFQFLLSDSISECMDCLPLDEFCR
jgi:hypothetical protein